MRVSDFFENKTTNVLKLPLMISLLYGVSTGIGLGSVLEGVSATPSLGVESLISQSVPETFRDRDIPPQNSAPPIFDVDTSQQFNLYRLAIGDSISVNIRDFPEFSFTALIDPEGQIRVPFLGKMPIVGLTLDEVQTKIAYELGQRYLQEEPEVIAILTGPRPVQLTILGEVRRPGYYFFGAGVSLNNVLAGVGGSTPLADLRSIIIRRRLVDGTVLEERVDLYTPLIQGKRLPDLRLQGGDTIIVSKLQIDQKDYDQNLIARTNLAQPSIRIRVLVPINPAGLAIRDLVLPNGSTFLDAVANLPPITPLSNKEEITLMRFDPEQGKVVSQGLNPIRTVQNLDATQYVTLRNEDVIVVSRTLFGNILAAFNVITQPIRDLFGFTNFISNLDNFN